MHTCETPINRVCNRCDCFGWLRIKQQRTLHKLRTSTHVEYSLLFNNNHILYIFIHTRCCRCKYQMHNQRIIEVRPSDRFKVDPPSPCFFWTLFSRRQDNLALNFHFPYPCNFHCMSSALCHEQQHHMKCTCLQIFNNGSLLSLFYLPINHSISRTWRGLKQEHSDIHVIEFTWKGFGT